MINFLKHTKVSRGFTLIELLVVISIIGILSTVVLSSLGTARTKARDARRTSDMQAIQVSLELYADSSGGAYPTTAAGLASLSPTYMPVVPSDPLTANGAYKYAACGTTGYHLGAIMETASSTGLNSDSDSVESVSCTTDFEGISTDCGLTPSAANADRCYDIKR